ncbi:fimbrillin family protein [Bacteroides sp.]|uniref:fimbrillin family protein n=1 Tax=Bacteroides sp. TaxID=29523 RepID=UPI0026274811|nr:fimbrillin family protein [Bacteroides sp.]MDD3036936.1 fimbrillin family protein [Bacteroides sp.]
MKTGFLALAAVATIALASCSKSEDVAVNVLPEDGVIRVTAGVNNLATRAGVDDATLNQFGLYIINSNEGAPADYTYENIYMKKTPESGKWTPSEISTGLPLSTPLLWNRASEKVTVTAYSPYLENITSMSANNYVAKDQTAAEASTSSDLLWAKSEVTPSNPNPTNDIYYNTSDRSLTVQMSHKLSKLRVNIKYGNELTQGGVTPTLGNVVLSDTRCNYTFDLNEGVVTLDPNNTNPEDITMHHETTDDSNFAAICEAILVPQDAKFSVRITVNGVVYEYTYPSNYTFESGKLYRLDLTVGKDMVTPSGITSSEWGEGNGTGVGVETE